MTIATPGSASRTAASDDNHPAVGDGVVVEQGDGGRARPQGVADAPVDAAGETEVDVVAQHGEGHRGDLPGKGVEDGQ